MITSFQPNALSSLQPLQLPHTGLAGTARPQHPQVSRSNEDAASLGRQPSLEAVAIPGEESPEADRERLRVDASIAPSFPG